MFSLESSSGRTGRDTIFNIHSGNNIYCEIASNSKLKLMNVCDQAININSKYAYPQGLWCLNHQIPNPPNSIQTQIASRAAKKHTKTKRKNKHPLLQDYQHLEIWIRCSLNIVGAAHVGHHADELVAVRVHQQLVSRQALLFLQQSVPAATGPQRSNCMHRTRTRSSQYYPYKYTNMQVTYPDQL